ncbi:NUDIX domain-containing protein [Epidermidibacterium keratini]|uniref:NUDIX domain-containing protein n=1 Tax=Epidermidibacterium keratini TaxID=1891644 RepID=A0A7L4YR28_9ACTN|nr:NUDIX domain-containing protein [Epidermidibacterium keratini]QHC01393.1 NUDIX domain-containing protein [Epidermidibacterium keratini]
MSEPSSSSEVTPVIRQRVGAYGVLTREYAGARQLLLTRISPWDYGAGMWTLPGGGIDHGEHPDDGVRREFEEETSLRVHPVRPAVVTSLHVTDYNRAGVLEDFQGIGIVYFVEAEPGQDLDDLQILEQDSSTDAVEWINIDALGKTDRVLTNVAKAALTLLTAAPSAMR